jgi:[ribosomal protein S5]-alanine N-acetyltransferase
MRTAVGTFPVRLAGTGVCLREFEADDVPAALAIVGDPAVTRWLSFGEKDLASTAAMIEGILRRARAEPRPEYYLVITSTVDPSLIGFVRLGLTGVGAAKLGYAVAARHWGRGIAADAARTLIAYGFSELGLHRITAAVGPDNQRSVRTLLRLGFTLEGRLRDHVFTNGGWRDSALYSLLAPEWLG